MRARRIELDAADHARGPDEAVLILEYGDYECPYSRAAYREIQRVERQLDGRLRFAFRHYPLTPIHPHALAASAAAEAAALQERFWPMHDALFHGQEALEDDDLRRYAADLGLDLEIFDRDRGSSSVMARIERDVKSATATRSVRGTPTLFIAGALYEGGYGAQDLIKAVAAAPTNS